MVRIAEKHFIAHQLTTLSQILLWKYYQLFYTFLIYYFFFFTSIVELTKLIRKHTVIHVNSFNHKFAN